MRNLNHQLKQLCKTNRDGSRATQANRERILTLLANELHELGFRGLGARALKPKHVDALVARWQSQKLAIGTIKNRMAALRWWARHAGRQNVVARENDHYGIPKRTFVARFSKAQELSERGLARVTDEHVRMSLRLQRAFGLRREEAIKIQPAYADRGDHLVLKASWTKGGKSRQIPVSAAQRLVLDQARALAGKGSLIPPARNYRQQLRVYERNTQNAGFSKMHGLRHAYAQSRYLELTGWPAPAAGGHATSKLNHEQRLVDRRARLLISRELGHEREQITAIYLGR